MVSSPSFDNQNQNTTQTNQLTNTLENAIKSSHEYFIRNQKDAGYWCAPLEADSTLVADYLFFAYYIDRVDEKLQNKAIKWIFDTQLEDGGWNIYHGGPSELNATIKCAFAMQLAGISHSDPRYRKAVECLLRLGGLDEANSYTRFYLALFKQIPWDKVVAIPPELMFLPTSFYFNIYEISSWSRAILVPLSILWAQKPLKEPPANVDCSGWWVPKNQRPASSILDTFSWKTFSSQLMPFLSAQTVFTPPLPGVRPFAGLKTG